MSVLTEPELYNRAEAAVELGVSVATVDNWARDGRLTPYRKGRNTVFLPEEVSRVKAERTQLKPIEVANVG